MPGSTSVSRETSRILDMAGENDDESTLLIVGESEQGKLSQRRFQDRPTVDSLLADRWSGSRRRYWEWWLHRMGKGRGQTHLPSLIQHHEELQKL